MGAVAFSVWKSRSSLRGSCRTAFAPQCRARTKLRWVAVATLLKPMKDREYDREKLKSLFHYVISTAGARAGFGATKLYKVAWFSDAKSYVMTGRSITRSPYIREKHGPIPKDGIILRNELVREGKIKQWRGTSNEWVFSSTLPPIINSFTQEELKEIKYWIKHIDEDYTALSISEQSHDYGWEIAEMKELLPFYSILAQRLREPSEEEMDWAKKQASILGLV